MTKRRAGRKSIPGLHADPATLDWASGAATNRAALTPKQKRDAQRITLKVELAHAPIIRDQLNQIATELNTSISQLAAWLLAYALIHYQQYQPEVLLTPSRTPRFANNVDSQPLLERLAYLAKRSPSATTGPPSEPIDEPADEPVDQTQQARTTGPQSEPIASD